MKRKYSYAFPKKSRKEDIQDDIEDKEEEDSSGVGIGILKSLMKQKVDCIGNHIWFNTDVTNQSISQLIKIIHAKNFLFSQKKRESEHTFELIPKPLYLHITSYGGDLLEGMAGVDCIVNSTIPIYTIVEGYAASAATFLSVVGKKRYMTKNSVLLIHQLSAGAWGKMEELEDEHRNNTFFMKKIYSLYERYTDISREKLEKKMKRDIWWGYKKCKKYGFVDEVYVEDEL